VNRPARRWRDDDRGAMTLMIAVVAMALFLMVGLSVDGGGRMQAIERADDLAAEAARAAGQALDLPQAVTGTADVVDHARAQAAVQDYLAGAGATDVSGFVVDVAPNGRSVTVTVDITYHPIFLGVIGLGPWTETGKQTATLLTG
jgi:Flp pilus assembly protein TadG